ncbi:MAG: DNA topoisomerase III, partial [Oscillibacter sp.]|nr:DNA topoisomerase III [Oscillibacter sp.]
MEHHGIRLLVAEKPSVGVAIGAVLGAVKKHNGWLEGARWRVSWCLGHLVELSPPEAYDPRYSKWDYGLPIIPQDWRQKVIPETRQQYEILAKLMNDPGVEEIVEATDAGKEGELIFRRVYQQCGCTKPVKRLWISSLGEDAIQDGLAHLREASEYDGLYQAADCRTKADWLVGMNLTRRVTTFYGGETLNVGRVMTPTLALLVEREKAIAGFHKETFHTVELSLPGFRAASGRFVHREEAEKLRFACSGTEAIVQTVERKEKKEQPPKLYDLTTLQREANRLFGYTAQQTLDFLQSLYEKRLATYPRTDSRFLTDDMAEELPDLCRQTAATLPFLNGLPIPVHASLVTDNSKVSDHHAVIPTAEAAHADLGALPRGERDILRMIAVRLLCAVGEPHRYAETAV